MPSEIQKAVEQQESATVQPEPTSDSSAPKLDISDTIISNSDQLNADDIMSGTKTVTITGASRGTPEQPLNLDIKEFPGKQFRPSKTVRRILVAAWGPDALQYIGKSMTIYRDPKVRWAGKEVGGIRISALSHIDKVLQLSLSESQGKSSQHTIAPLKIKYDEIPSSFIKKVRGGGLSDEEKKKALDYLTGLSGPDPKLVEELRGLVE